MSPLMKKLKKMGKVFSCIDSEESPEPRLPYRKRMVIIGDGACGKTCLVTRMCTGNFVDVGYLPTVFETEVVSVNTGKEEVDLTIFDTAGQEDYDRLRPFSYHDIDVALICFNLADTDTLINVTEKWSPEVRYFCGNIPIILVGNKKDLRDMPDTTTTDITGKSPSSPSVGEISSNSAEKEISADNDKNGDDNNNNDGDKEDSENGSLSSSSVVEIDNRLSCLINQTTAVSNERVQPHIKRSEGALIARRIGAVAYFETSALSGDNVQELLLATTKASVLGCKKSKKFKPMLDTLKNWTSVININETEQINQESGDDNKNRPQSVR